MIAAVKNLIASIEHAVETLNLERDHEYAIKNERRYDQLIHDLGKNRMTLRAILFDLKYGEWRDEDEN